MKAQRNETMVGMFVIIGLVLLSVVVFFVSGVYFFRSGYSVKVKYNYVSILDRGAPVRMAGVRVGEVSDVALVYDEEMAKNRVEVKLFIEKGVEIRENYLFLIQGTHILSEPHIEISPRPGNAPILKDGKTLEGEDPVAVEALIEQANQIAENLSAILEDFRLAVQDEETADALKRIVLNVASLTESLNLALSGSEEEMKEAIVQFRSVMTSLAAILKQVESGEGTLGKLTKEDELYQELRDFVAEIKARPWRLLKKDKK